MGKFGQAAIAAENILLTNKTVDPNSAWEIATIQIFGKGTSSQMKGCPRDTFLGLCKEGLVKGVAPGNYTQSKKNKKYAIEAINILKNDPQHVFDEKELWAEIMKNDIKKYNQQMDVVLALWNSNLIST